MTLHFSFVRLARLNLFFFLLSSLIRFVVQLSSKHQWDHGVAHWTNSIGFHWWIGSAIWLQSTNIIGIKYWTGLFFSYIQSINSDCNVSFLILYTYSQIEENADKNVVLELHRLLQSVNKYERKRATSRNSQEWLCKGIKKQHSERINKEQVDEIDLTKIENIQVKHLN